MKVIQKARTQALKLPVLTRSSQPAEGHRLKPASGSYLNWKILPAYIPRNHWVEEALEAAGRGDYAPFERLLAVLQHPFEERPELKRYTQPATPEVAAGYRTFCGT